VAIGRIVAVHVEKENAELSKSGETDGELMIAENSHNISL
jgi:hypothetical protein